MITNKEEPVETRHDVEVRCRFDGTWVSGFQVTESTEVAGEKRFRLMRVSDRTVLPELFGPSDIRPRLIGNGRLLPISGR